MSGGDNQYDVPVFRYASEDKECTPLMRALHAELCRPGSLGLHNSAFPACWRAADVVRRAQADGRLG